MTHYDPDRLAYIEGRLLDEQDRRDWEQSRADDLGLTDPPTPRESMIRALGAERAAVETEWALADDAAREAWRRGWVAQVAIERERSNQQQQQQQTEEPT